MKKKISIIVLCFFMLTIFAGGAAAKNNNPQSNNGMKNSVVGKLGPQLKFMDIDSDWAKDEINKAAQKGFMQGYGDEKFQPNKPITCLETIVALMSTLEQEGAIDLDDVDIDDCDSWLNNIPEWAKVYVAAALEEGILLESEMDSFNPNQGIKRYQAAVYFARLTESGYDEYFEDIIDEVKDFLEDIIPELNGYKDLGVAGNFFRFNDEDEIPLQAQNSVIIMQQLRIMFGDTDGKFSPMRVVKRNELAAMLNRLDDNYFCRQDCELITGILDEIDYDEDQEIFILSIIDEDGNAVDEIEFNDDDKLFYEGKIVEFDDDVDENEAAIEDIDTGGKIKVCINSQDELAWVKIYAPEED
ncbi:MAG TPA: S-layer homology domain-containing protein [Syntrophomonadaceae bacterium]|nr:S-layer homology domain-containing protein [Syntrophomonadaceae bacterium]